MSYATPLKDTQLNKLLVKEYEKDPKRKSPPYHANDLPNHYLEGMDGEYWLSIPDKNNIYKWKKISIQKDIESYLKQFPNEKKNLQYKYKIDTKILKKISDILAKHKIYIVYVPWKTIYYYIEWWSSQRAWNDAGDILINNGLSSETPHIYFTAYDNHKAKLTGKLTFYFKFGMDKKIRDLIYETFSIFYKKVEMNKYVITITL